MSRTAKSSSKLEDRLGADVLARLQSMAHEFGKLHSFPVSVVPPPDVGMNSQSAVEHDLCLRSEGRHLRTRLEGRIEKLLASLALSQDPCVSAAGVFGVMELLPVLQTAFALGFASC